MREHYQFVLLSSQQPLIALPWGLRSEELPVKFPGYELEELRYLSNHYDQKKLRLLR